jgi:hypothetical protein
MYVPVDDIIYSVWDPIKHEHILKSNNEEFITLYFNSHANKRNLQLWKIITLHDPAGEVKHYRLDFN